MSSKDSGSDASFPIAAVERETGLSKDILRVWEKRYGFPQPERDIRGDRIYPAQQVRQLQLIQQLLAGGMRPGKVVGLGMDELQRLRTELAPVAMTTRPPTTQPEIQAVDLEPFLQAIAAHGPYVLRTTLHQAQARLGLSRFIIEVVAPLTTAVGTSWSQGRFDVFEEHLYTEVLTGVLRQSIAIVSPAPDSPGQCGPKVLLTTLPSESHGIGLLMVEALLTLQGCICVSLGTQTPQNDIVLAAAAHEADVVALSFSAQQTSARALSGLRGLRKQLPHSVELWAGGSCSALYESPLDGIMVARPLTALASMVSHWRDVRTHT